jgi:hypothetical protein
MPKGRLLTSKVDLNKPSPEGLSHQSVFQALMFYETFGGVDVRVGFESTVPRTRDYKRDSLQNVRSDARPSPPFCCFNQFLNLRASLLLIPRFFVSWV